MSENESPRFAAGAPESSGETNTDYNVLAHRLHDLGFHVFPVDHPDHPECIGKHGPTSPCDGKRGKHPAVKFGTWAVAATAQMIDLEWEKHGGLANIGIACGPSELVVLDEDQQGELERWCAAYGITLPQTYTVHTGRGRHLYFHWDHSTKPIGNSSKAMDGFKIDVRGNGGFVIAEASQHENGPIYTANGHPTIADLPNEVAELLLAATRNGQTDHKRVFESTADDHTAQISDGERHNALLKYAGRLRKSGLDYQEVLQPFHERWLYCEQPEGQIPEARFHTTTCRYPLHLGRSPSQTRRRLRTLPGRQKPQRGRRIR
jgi:hypothetical protein